MIALWGFANTTFAVDEAGPDDAGLFARIHERAVSAPWSEEEFETLLAQRAVLGLTGLQSSWWGPRQAGFALSRIAKDEAELLMIAVVPSVRRAGMGRALLDALVTRLMHLGVTKLFLEVDESNMGGVTLYRRAGFVEVGRRKGYYPAEPGRKAPDALVMRLDIA